MVEGYHRWGITHAQEGPEVVGAFHVDGRGFVPVGMVKKLDVAGRRDEHGNTHSLGVGKRREDSGVFHQKFVVVLAGCGQFCVVSRPGVCEGVGGHDRK